MKLPFDLICHHLSVRWTVRRYPDSGIIRDISIPMLYTGKEGSEVSGTLIARTEDLSSRIYRTDADCLILIGADPAFEYRGNAVSIVFIEEDASPFDVLNCIQECFFFYMNWENTMERIVTEGGSMQQLLDVSLPVFGNRLDITDAAHAIMATVQNNTGSRSLPYPDFVISAELFAEYQNAYADQRKRKGAFLWQDVTNPDKNPYPAICVNLMDGNIFAGAVTLMAVDHPFRSYDFRLMERLAGYVNRVLFDEKRSEQPDYVVLLRDQMKKMIAGESVAEDLFSHLAAMADFTDKYDYMCIVTGIRQDPPKGYEKFLRQKILDIFPDSIIFIYGEYLVTVTKDPHASARSTIGRFSVLMSDMGLYAGMSDPFSDLLSLKQYYIEAEYALHEAISDLARPYLSCFRNYVGKYILQNCCGELNSEQLYPDGLKRLIDYDRTAHVSYIDTLRAYLDSDRNAARTAKVLSISRNTFLTRMEKLDSLLNMDLNDPDSRLLLNICLKLLEPERHN